MANRIFIIPVVTSTAGLICGVAIALSIADVQAQRAGVQLCSREVVRTMLDPTTPGPVELTCSVTLPKGAIIRKNIIFTGSGASGATLDCNGATIDTSWAKGRFEKTAIIVRSRKIADGRWDAPQFVSVKNCVIKGFIRLYGMDQNANGANMRESSRQAEHTELAQAAAPKRTNLLNLSIIAPQGAPVYVGPGVTWTTLANSRLSGTTTGTAIYLDAESGSNYITNNIFSVRTKSRELIAVDSSSHNEITGNTFYYPGHGGVFLYRNCGEAGVIRHQTPNFNTISNNTFVYDRDDDGAKPAIWLGSRGGRQRYCFSDPAHPFGSSLSSQDFAMKNTVENNLLIGGKTKLIVNTDQSNVVRANRVE